MSESRIAWSDDEQAEMVNRKLDHTFKWWDQNGDGWVTEDDLEQMANMFNALVDDGDEENKSAMHKGLFKWWQLILDNREDKMSEKLGKQEFIRTMRANVVHPENIENTIACTIDGMLRALDRDKNGSLSLEEYLEMYKRLRIPTAFGAEAFKRLDRDGDGEISHAEFRQACMEWYLSPDPHAPGQWLLGPPQEYL